MYLDELIEFISCLLEKEVLEAHDLRTLWATTDMDRAEYNSLLAVTQAVCLRKIHKVLEDNRSIWEELQ